MQPFKLTANVCGLAMLPKTDAQKRDAVEVTMSSQIEKLNGNIAKPLVTRSQLGTSHILSKWR